MKDTVQAASDGASTGPAIADPSVRRLAETIDIVIADQRQLICEGIRSLLCEHPGIRVGAVARSRKGLFDALDAALPDVLLLNPRLDADGGVPLVHALRDTWPRMPVLVLASDAESEDPVALVRAGAHGYLSRDHDADDLVHAVRRIARGGLFVSKELGESIATGIASGMRHEHHSALSPREAEVFGLLAQGRTVSQIARVLSLSVKTVSTHKTRLMGRLGLGSLSELIQYAISHGLIDGADGSAGHTGGIRAA